MTRHTILPALLAPLAIGVFVADVALFPGLYVPAVAYVIPILLAAYFLPSPRLVAGVAVWTIALQTLAYLLEGAGLPLLPASYTLGLSLMAALSVTLTERARREAVLRHEAESERRNAEYERQRWIATVESMVDPVALCDAEGRVTYVNPAYARRIGYLVPPDLPIEEHPRYYQLYRPDGTLFEAEELPLQRAAFRGEEVHDVEVVERTADGREFIAVFNASPLRNGEGRLVGAVAVGRDVTEWRRAEVERDRLLKETDAQRSLFQAVVDHAPAGIAVLRGPEFVFEVVNPAYQAIAPGKELVGRTVAETWPELADQVLPLLERVLRTGEPFHAVNMPFPIRRGPDAPLEEVYFTFSYVPMQVPGSQVDGILVVVLETTQQVTACRQMEDLARQKADFIKVAAHELKTPVAIMKGYAEAILRRTGDVPRERRKMLEAIDHGANRIDRIVDDLLDISKLHAGHLELTRERIDLSQLVEQVVDETALTTTRHRLQVASTEPVIVEGDRHRLEQVVATLIDNAVRYSPMGGEIDVEVARRDGEAQVSVSDQGVGIPQEKQSGIFQRFYRAHTGTPYDYGGMGVGLYIACEIVTRHGGKLWFESKEGSGSTFHFGLPL